MCTAISLNTHGHYFGRTLDLEHRYREEIVVMPRRFPLALRRMPGGKPRHAVIGAAAVEDGFPLYYDAANEAGLAAAALNFPGFAHYVPDTGAEDGIAPFELIPLVLSRCENAAQARQLLRGKRIIDVPFSEKLPASPLHWLIADQKESIAVEQTASGLAVMDHPARVMTNSPPLDHQLTQLAQHMALSPRQPQNACVPDIPLLHFGRGMGAFGLPGDWSSPSRFVRAAFLAAHSACGESEEENVRQLFHLLAAVSHPRGCVLTGDQYEITQYTSCFSARTGVYYLTTYESCEVVGVDMHRENLNAAALIRHPIPAPAPPRMIN